MKLHRIFSVALVATGLAACSSSGRPDLSEMSFSEDPLVGKIIWYDLITEDAAASQRFHHAAGMVPVTSDSGANISRWLPYVSVEDVDAAMIRTNAWGGSVAAEARDLDIGRVGAIIDPQGAVMGLARSEIGDPDDNTTAAANGRPIWTELLADDAMKAAAFYESVVGYDVNVIERRGGVYIMLSNGGAYRAGILQNPTDWKPAWLTHFAVADPAAAAGRVEALGGRVLLAPTPEVREGTVAIVADPAGAILALQKWPL